MAPPSKPASADKVSAVIFQGGVEIQGFGQVASANPARMPGARLELTDHGVLITLAIGPRTLVPYSMCKSIYLAD